MKPTGYGPRNPIIAPKVREFEEVPETPMLVKLYGIKKTVSIVVCYDVPGPPVLVESMFSHHLLDELFTVAKRKATVVRLEVDGQPVTPSTIARINRFVSQPGYTSKKTFRGWRRHLIETMENGHFFWNTAPSWEQFEQIVNLLVFNPKTPVKPR